VAIASGLGDLASANPDSPLALPLLTLLNLLLLVLVPLVVIVMVAIPVLGLAYLIAGSVGLQVQREAVAELVQDRPGFGGYARLWLLAGLIALGLEAGFLLVPLAAFSPRDLFTLALIPPWLLAVLLLTGLGLIYARFFARRLLGAHTGASPPHSKRRLLTAVLTGLLGLLYLPLLAARVFIYAGGPGGLDPDGRSLLGGFVLATFLVALLLSPLIFGATWVVIEIGRLLRPPRCAACGSVTRQRPAVGKACETCGQPLAPWLYANS